jgi:hypothetical protein
MPSYMLLPVRNKHVTAGGDETVLMLREGTLPKLLEAAGVTGALEADQTIPVPVDKVP